MGNDIQKGTVYAEGGVGGAGTVNASNLNAHVDEAVIKASFVSSKTLKDPAALDDTVLVENSGVLYRETMQQIMDLIANSVKIPTGIIMDFAGTSLPEGWLFCFGQAISRDTYNLLWNCIGTTYGAGDGSTTFLVPDLRGRVAAGKDDMGGISADRMTSLTFNGDILGGAGGDQVHTLTVAQLPAHQHAYMTGTGNNGPYNYTPGSTTHSFEPTVTGVAGSGSAHPNVQPTIILNKIIRYL